jgi:crossover junction endodeoxyribonuclease RusA
VARIGHQARVDAILDANTAGVVSGAISSRSGPSPRVLAFTLPYPVSANRIWRRGRTWDGRIVIHKSDEAKAYELAVHVHVLRQLDHATWNAMLPPFTLSIRLYPPDRRRRDVDNPCKNLVDSLFRSLGRDDVTVQRLEVERMEPDRERPRCEVTIREAR